MRFIVLSVQRLTFHGQIVEINNSLIDQLKHVGFKRDKNRVSFFTAYHMTNLVPQFV